MRHVVLTCLVALAAAGPGLAVAQSAPSADAQRLQLTRDALRQAQAALQQSRDREAAQATELTALKAERDRLAAERDAALRRARAGAGLAPKLQAQTERADQAEQALAAQRSAAEQAAREAEARAQALTRQGNAAETLLRERTQANAALVALLERNLKALAEAEALNRQLHAAGERVVEAFRERHLYEERLIGFESVRLQSQAEAMRAELDALRVVPAAR